MIDPYPTSKIQQQAGGVIIRNYVSLTCTTIIDPATGWFKIVKVPCFGLDEVARLNYGYIDKLSARVSQMFNHIWSCR